MQPYLRSTRVPAVIALTGCLLAGCADDDASGDPLDNILTDAALTDAALTDAALTDAIAPVEPDPDDPSLAWGPTVTIGPDCVPPPLLQLEDIPNDPNLDDDNPDTGAVFEVDGA